MKKTTILNLFIASLTLLFIGLSSGYAVGYHQAQNESFPEIIPIQDTNPHISTVKFLKVEDGTLYGQIDGQKARLAHSPDHISDLNVGDDFQIPLNEINLASYYSVETIPDGVSYIASETGKYYYSILDPRALRLTPKNRQYFYTEDEDLNAGYIAPK